MPNSKASIDTVAADLFDMPNEPTGKLSGCLIGGAIGDALGLPYEGLSKRRAARLLGPPDRFRFLFVLANESTGKLFVLANKQIGKLSWQNSNLCGRGMCSDDTEHAILTAQAMALARGEADRFAAALAWRLRFWLLGLPAGVGFASLRAICKLWLGFPPHRSGVFSAGNGPAMRSAIIGAASTDIEMLKAFVLASTRLTHTDPKAYVGALSVALCAFELAHTRKLSLETLIQLLREHGVLGPAKEEFLTRLELIATSLARGQSTQEFSVALGLEKGVTGYMFHSVPVALHGYFSNPQCYASAVQSVILCGGDTDSTAAVTGALVGITVGTAGIPQHWREQLFEWPYTVAKMHQLAAALATSRVRPCRLPTKRPIAVVVRNIGFLIAVGAHVVRRLLPPWT
jgi:ADP-ribosyl-[dinitrogen reductase] hydrolase